MIRKTALLLTVLLFSSPVRTFAAGAPAGSIPDKIGLESQTACASTISARLEMLRQLLSLMHSQDELKSLLAAEDDKFGKGDSQAKLDHRLGSVDFDIKELVKHAK